MLGGALCLFYLLLLALLEHIAFVLADLLYAYFTCCWSMKTMRC